MKTKNPLLAGSELPRFDQICPEHIGSAVDHVLTRSGKTICVLENLTEPPDWDNFAGVLESLEENIDRVWSPVTHLNSVVDSEALRTEYEKNLVKVTSFFSELGQNEALYRRYQLLADGDQAVNLSVARRKVIDNAVRDFKLAGVALPRKQKTRFREIQTQLSTLQNQFSQNVLDATQAWHLDITDEAELAGLPQSSIDLARNTAGEAGKEGWRFGLQIPSYLPFMTHADSAGLRETMYQAYITRASSAATDATSGGKFDNGPLIAQILSLRDELANLLGFRHFADVSLSTKMADSADQVVRFLDNLTAHARPMAQRELQELETFAKDELGIPAVRAWDIPYCAEKLRQARYGFSDEEVKPYFPAGQVLDSLFGIAGRLFDISIEIEPGVATWHPDVCVYRIITSPGREILGRFFADLYVRPNKRSGAWMDTCIHKRRLTTGLQSPAAHLVCNFTPSVDDKPALLTHDEVVTLFHEFGHTLHHLLTEIEEMGVGGINGVSWDAVELPSQFMENWCWQREALDEIGRHHLNGESLPDALLEKMRAAKNFQSGLQTLRQVEFALFDMALHTSEIPPEEARVQEILDEVRSDVAVLFPPPYNRFQNSFSHIFAGGYAAGYYSYKWAEVLSSDAFSRFEEEGIFNPGTGLEFRKSILARGGSEDPDKLFREFRGREPQIDALLRHNGLNGGQATTGQ